MVVTPPAAAARVVASNPSRRNSPGALTYTWVSTTPGMIAASRGIVNRTAGRDVVEVENADDLATADVNRARTDGAIGDDAAATDDEIWQKHVLLQPDEIQLDLLVSVFARPEVQRRRRHFVHQRIGQAQTREIHRLQIVPAAVARVHAHVIEDGCMESNPASFRPLPHILDRGRGGTATCSDRRRRADDGRRRRRMSPR